MKSIKDIENKIIELKSKLMEKTYEVEHATIREAKETHEAALILLHMAEGKTVSKDEVHFLIYQSIDLGKALTIIGLQAVPFSSVAIIAMEVAANKHGFSLFPTSQTNENIENNPINI